MAEHKLEDYLAVALDLARKAGEVIKTNFFNPKKIQTKSSSADCVTETDQACEDLVIAGIKKAFPSHKIIAEESYSASGATDYNLTDEPTWCIDPLDGTSNFVHTIPFVCVSIGLIINKKSQVAVVHNPIIGETFHAIHGQGSFLNGQRLKSSTTTDITQSCLLTECGYDRVPTGVTLMLENLRNFLHERVRAVRMLGSCALNMSYVAAGRAEMYYEGKDGKAGPKPWDFAAGMLIASEAGALVSDVDGSEFTLYNGRVLVTANASIQRQAVDLLAQYLTVTAKEKEKMIKETKTAKL